MLDKLGVAASTSKEKARNDAMEEGRKIQSRNDINIMLAERYSWEAVDYVQKPYACDSGDEKLIRRAIKESKTSKAESRKPLKPRAQLIGRSQQFDAFTSNQNYSSARRIVISASSQNWMQAKTKGVFVAEDLGISRKTSAHLSPQPQREKCTKIASQTRFIGDADIYSNYDLDAKTESELGLIELYNRLGMSEHGLNFDITSDVPDLVEIHGLTVAGCPAGDSPEEGPVCVKGRLRDRPSFCRTAN